MAELIHKHLLHTKFEEIPEGSYLFCVDLTWNDPGVSYIIWDPSFIYGACNIYIRLITRVSVRYGEIFHEPKASEISRHISELTSVISALFL